MFPPLAARSSGTEQPGIPDEIDSDWQIVFPSSTENVSIKQRQAALKRMVSIIIQTPTDTQNPSLIAFTTTHVIPRLISALTDRTLRPFLLSVLHTLCSSAYPSLHSATLYNLHDILSAHLPVLVDEDIDQAYGLVQSLLRFHWAVSAIQPTLSTLIGHVARKSSDIVSSKPSLKVIALILPKLDLDVSDVSVNPPFPSMLLSKCSDMLLSVSTDTDLRRLSALIIVQSISLSPAWALPLLSISYSPSDFSHDFPALHWALSIRDDVSRTLALQIVVTSAVHTEPLFVHVVPELVRTIQAPGANVSPVTVLVTLSIMTFIAPKLNSNDHLDLIKLILDSTWSYLDHNNDTIQARARSVVDPLLSQLDLDPESLVDRVLSNTISGSKVQFLVLSTVVPIAGPHAVWQVCKLETAQGMDVVLDALAQPRLVRRIAEFITTLTQALFPKNRPHNVPSTIDSKVDALATLVLRGLDSQTELVRTHLVSHILHPLFINVPNIYNVIVDQMDSNNIGARISVERVARLLNLSTPASDTSILLAATMHTSAQLRLDTLGLLSDVCQATQPVQAVELAWLRHFITYNMDSCNPNFRDGVCSRLARIFERLRNSAYSVSRQVASVNHDNVHASNNAETLLDEYKLFMSWILMFIPALIGRPGCPYATAITGLGVLDVLITAFGIGAVPMPHGYHPDHCAKPQFPFPVQIDSEYMVGSILLLLRTCKFDQVLLQSHVILSRFRIGAHLLPDLLKWAQCGVSSPRGYDATAGALLYDLAFRVCVSHGILVNVTEEPDAARNFYQHLVKSLKSNIAKGQSSLVLTSENVSVPGVFLALETILSHMSNPHEWATVLPNLCSAASEMVKDMLSIDAPEGSVPEDYETNCGDNIPDTNAADLVMDVRSKTSQLVLSFSWRVIKHSCDLLGRLVSRLDPKIHTQLLSAIGDQFIHLMLKIRHRGAFQAIQPNLVRVVHQLAQISTSTLGHWMSECVRAAAHTDYSVTRRSGGLPYVILGLLTSPRSRQYVPSTMEAMLLLVEAPESSEAVKVNAMNITRRLLGDSVLANDTIVYTERALVLAIDHLYMPEWGVRNAALMLYSALLNRIFGSHSAVNSGITAHTFFRRYPKLYTTLITHLTNAYEEGDPITSHCRAFSLLLLITCMTPSPAGSSIVSYIPKSTADNIGSLLSLFECVSNYLSSPVWKVREVAARAMVALSQTDTMLEHANVAICRAAAVIGESASNHNTIHGTIMYIHNLLMAAVSVHGKEEVACVTRKSLMSLVIIMQEKQMTPFSLSVAIQIATSLIIDDFGPIAINWFSLGVHTGYGSELVKARLAKAVLSANSDPSALTTLLVHEKDESIHEIVLGLLADKFPGHLLPIPPTVVQYLTNPCSPHAEMRIKILIDTGYSIPASYLLDLARQSLQSPKILIPPLICALAKASFATPEICAQYLDMIQYWSEPEHPIYIRISCASSLHDGLEAVHACLGDVGLVRLVWIATNRLLVDDDVDVRESTCAALSRTLNLSGVGCTSSALVPPVFNWLVDQGRANESTRSLLVTQWNSYLKATLSPMNKAVHCDSDKKALFGKDNANQFKDNLREAIAISGAMLALNANLDNIRVLLNGSALKDASLDSQNAYNAVFVLQYLSQGHTEMPNGKYLNQGAVELLAENFAMLKTGVVHNLND